MRRAGAWLLGSVLIPGMGVAADVAPDDFAHALPIVTTKEAPVYRFALPLDVYRGIARDDLGDLRVFNAANEAVPYSLRRPPPPAPTREAATVLPSLGLRGSARAVLEGERLRVDPPGAAAAPTQGGASVNQYILDGRSLGAAVAALQLHWPEAAADYSGRVRIEVSDDLDAWQLLVAAAPTANLHANGQTLIENRVTVPPTRARFWRIAWVGPPPRFELTSVWAEPADAPAEAAHVSLDVAGVHDADLDADGFDLQARLPVSQLNVTLPESNTVSTIELASRRTPGDPWRTVTQAGFYRLKTADGEQHNAPIDIAPDRDRYWRARILKGGALPRLPLRLHVEWVPNEVTFLARGKPPFMLAYGNAAAAGAEADLSQVPADVEIAPAAVGTLQVVGGSSRPASKPPPPPDSWKRTAVWAAAVLAATLLGWMAFRLARERRA